ncbi:MAG: substrate-binding domain-containing protein [Betaproteobacteria bacterium]
MKAIAIKPAWLISVDGGDRFEPQLFRLLRAVNDTGKLTAATRALGLSYRHAWDLLAKWAATFGSPLVSMERGKGARLTPLGHKFLWAEQRVMASLFPQLENIASELNAEISRAGAKPPSHLRMHASHGYAVEKLPELMRRAGNAAMELRYMGSVEALASLARGQCDVAGFHVALGDLAPSLWEPYAPWIRAAQQRIIRLATRTQGLMVQRGNPLGIRKLADLAKRGVKFVNRQPTSGTRVLLDGLLHAARIDARRISGYDSGEFTHAAVAAFVASGAANVGLGVEPAARQFHLDFIPVITERYMLACNVRTLDSPALKELIAVLKSPAFAKTIDTVPGYTLDEAGEVLRFADAMPWLGAASNTTASTPARRATTKKRTRKSPSRPRSVGATAVKIASKGRKRAGKSVR